MLMQTKMWRKKHLKLMIDQCRICSTESIVGFTCEPVMSMGMCVPMATIPIQLRKTKHRKPMLDQRRMWRTEGVVLECLKIGQYISDM
jgi:hypothetical protein